MPLQSFHPVIQEWFSTTLGEPTDVQKASWPAIQSGKHALISAPTGSGKTLAAFLTCIDRLLHQAIHGELVRSPRRDHRRYPNRPPFGAGRGRSGRRDGRDRKAGGSRPGRTLLFRMSPLPRTRAPDDGHEKRSLRERVLDLGVDARVARECGRLEF